MEQRDRSGKARGMDEKGLLKTDWGRTVSRLAVPSHSWLSVEWLLLSNFSQCNRQLMARDGQAGSSGCRGGELARGLGTARLLQGSVFLMMRSAGGLFFYKQTEV